MLGQTTNRLTFTLIWGVLSLLVVMCLSIFGFTFYSEHSKFEAYLQGLEEQAIEQQKQYVIRETDGAAHKAEVAFVAANSELQAITKEEAYKVIEIIEQLHSKFEKKLGNELLTSLIKETLRPYRFASGRGYVFIADLSGTSILHPLHPAFEGTSFLKDESSNVAKIASQINDVINGPFGEGFIEYQWSMPNQVEHTYKKISYIKVFEPLGWIIGAGDYLNAYREKIEDEILYNIDRVRFGDDGYIAIVHADGTLLKSASARQLEGLHFNEMPEINGAAIKKIVEAAAKGKQFVDYQWFAPGQNTIQDKSSYIKQLPFNEWILVSGLYEHQINKALAQKKSELWDDFTDELIQLGTVFLILGGAFVVIAYLFTKWLNSRFKAYYKALSKRQKQLIARTEQLELSERIVKSATEGILVTDANKIIVHVNDAFTKITGYSRQEVIGEKPSKLSSGLHDKQFYEKLWRSIAETGTWEGEIWNRGKSGHTYPQWLKINAYLNGNGELLNFIATFKDLSEQKEAQAQVDYLSDYDPLTDLPNKRVIIDRLNQVLAHISRYPDQETALLFIDLDNFKRINDSLGYESGDRALKEIACRLKQAIREVDLLGRVTGDEFVIILEPSKDLSAIVTQLAFRLLESISKPVEEADSKLFITASIGISVAPDDGVDSHELIKHADLALNHAKEKGRNNFQFFTQSMNELATKRMLIENEINSALKSNEFKLLYQPQYNASTNQLSSVEALIRWNQPNGNVIPPDEFIPIAEETSQIIDIGEWTLNEACNQAAKWMSQGIYLPISVNISPVQILSDRFYDQVVNSLQRYNLDPHLLVLEITETALMKNEEVTIQKIDNLKKLDLNISLDDFGTGYSSLSLLKKVPVSELKIDKSFVDGLPFDRDDESICASIISVAQNMNLEVVAEGVETKEQLVVLQNLGCTKIQGYLFSPAVESKKIERLWHV